MARAPDCNGGKVHGQTVTGPWRRIGVTGGSAVVIDDNTLNGGPPGSPFPMITMTNCKSCEIKNNKLSNGHITGIAVAGSPGILVHGNQILKVGAHVTDMDYQLATEVGQSGAATGIHIASSPSCTVADNTVRNVDAAWNGEAIGIKLVDGAGCSVANNIVSSVSGGCGYQDGWSSTGRGVGILVTGAGPVSLAGNRVIGVTGGPGFAWSKMGSQMPGGAAMGIRCESQACTSLIGNAVVGVTPGVPYDDMVPKDPNWTPTSSACIDLVAPGTVAIDHLTCSGATIGVRTSGLGTVKVSNSIIANMTQCAFAGPPVAVSWTDLWNALPCSAELTKGAGILNVDPLFVDVGKGDVHVQCSASNCSGTIDAGNPAAAFCAEPAPNGCRVDLGAYGGTAQATPHPGGKQCACP